MPVAHVTGKSGFAKYNAATLSITKWSAKIARELADTTDSSNYDVNSDMLHKAQLPVSLQHEISVEGYFDLNQTPTTLVAQLYTGAAAVNVILNISTSVIYGHGLCDVSDFETETPVDDKVSWKATLKSNGVFVVGS